jgi:NADPH-dependent curcumin reductase CurA
VLVRTLMTSVDPYMLPRLRGQSSYTDPVALREPIPADSLGEVIMSRRRDVPVGSTGAHEHRLV